MPTSDDDDRPVVHTTETPREDPPAVTCTGGLTLPMPGAGAPDGD
jgi:hypothetical protein